MSILVLGDCHAAWTKLLAAVDRGVSIHAVTSVIQVGDFGFFPIYFPLLVTALGGRRFPVPVHVIDGNHEDHAWLWAQVAAGACELWAKDLNLIVHRRGDTAVIDGVKVGFLGGALHADRSQHGSTAKGTTNWVTDREADRASQAFADAGVELVVTHSCPHSIGIGMAGSPELFVAVERYIRAKGFDGGPFEDCGEPALTRLWASLDRRPRSWVYGHFHAHREVQVGDTGFRCVGSCDGSDGKSPAVGHLLDPTAWSWTTVGLGDPAARE